MQVRTANLDDLEELVAFSAEYTSLMQDSKTVEVLTLIGSIRSALLPNPSDSILVCEDEDGIFGVLWCTCFQGYPWNSELQAFDRLLYFTKGKRSFKAFRSLVKSYISWAEDRGCSECSLSSVSGIQPERTKTLYSRLGFSESGFINTMQL